MSIEPMRSRASSRALTLHQKDALGSKIEVGNDDRGSLEVFKVPTAALSVLCLQTQSRKDVSILIVQLW